MGRSETPRPAMDKGDLLEIARTPMPFGRFKGRMLIDLPEEYLLWFAQREFPKGKLGRLMQLALAIRIEGLEGLVKPLKDRAEPLGWKG